MGKYQISLRALIGLTTFVCVVGGLARGMTSPFPYNLLSLLGIELACVGVYLATFYRLI